MKSFAIPLAASLLHLVAADDKTVLVTITNTQTVCPYTPTNCPTYPTNGWNDWSSGMTTSGDWGAIVRLTTPISATGAPISATATPVSATATLSHAGNPSGWVSALNANDWASFIQNVGHGDTPTWLPSVPGSNASTTSTGSTSSTQSFSYPHDGVYTSETGQFPGWSSSMSFSGNGWYSSSSLTTTTTTTTTPNYLYGHSSSSSSLSSTTSNAQANVDVNNANPAGSTSTSSLSSTTANAQANVDVNNANPAATTSTSSLSSTTINLAAATSTTTQATSSLPSSILTTTMSTSTSATTSSATQGVASIGVPFGASVSVPGQNKYRRSTSYIGISGNDLALVNDASQAVAFQIDSDGVLTLSSTGQYPGVAALTGGQFWQLFDPSGTAPPTRSGWTNSPALAYPGASFCYLEDGTMVMTFGTGVSGCTTASLTPSYDTSSFNTTIAPASNSTAAQSDTLVLVSTTTSAETSATTSVLTTTTSSTISANSTTSFISSTTASTTFFAGNSTTTPGLSTTSYYANSTTTAANSTVTPFLNGTSTLNSTTTNSTSANTTSSTCLPTATNTGLAEVSCNSAADRSVWCGGESISSDYYTNNYNSGNTCSYSLTITNTTCNPDGTGDKVCLFVNGQSPGPLIECNWGDTVEISVTNLLTDNATTIHWHGIRQEGTNDQDGVPGISECGIAPGQSRTYSWLASSYGTTWYHSHLLTQYGDGVLGPIIIHGPATANYDIDMGVVQITDTFADTAAAMNSIISHSGPVGTVNYLLNGKNLNPFGAPGGEQESWLVQPGKKHLFRIINSAAQNMFSFRIDSHKMTVIASDLVPIVPYETEWLNIGIGQRYDVIIEADQPSAGYYVRAVTQTLCPSGCANDGLGTVNGIIQYANSTTCATPTIDLAGLDASDFDICADEPLESLVPYLPKTAGDATTFATSVDALPAGLVAQTNTSDDGVVYQWFINNGVINVNYSQPTLSTLANYGANSSLISNQITLGTANQWVYFVITNQFFAFHPLHLHGHDFSLLGQNTIPWDPSYVSTLNFVNPPRRDTAMLAGSAGPQSPAGYTVIGFETDNPGAWLMHCHIVWHVDGGLALQFLERPDDIAASTYVNKGSFQDECNAMNSYQAGGGAVHYTGESGLRRRYYEEFASGKVTNVETKRSKDVVRRAGNARRLGDTPGRGYGHH